MARQYWIKLGIMLILILALGLRLWRSDSFGVGYPYYTAASKNMLQSPVHFFFAVADYGSVTVDKPPAALWIQALFMAAFGVHGFSVILASVFASCLSIAILYRLVARDFGGVAGLIAAFVLATSPVAVAIDRTNNVDSVLILALLLAAWAILNSIRSNRKAYLFWGSFLLGIAFNIKMFQAYLIAPSLYLLYWASAKAEWRQKIRDLSLALVILMIVSFAWIIIVDAIPPEKRPYVGSTQTNSAFELAFGHNGIMRLIGSLQFRNLLSNTASQQTPQVTAEIGAVGALRFFQTGLANELSWLLPFVAMSMALLLWREQYRLPLDYRQAAVFLWLGWLVTGIIVFSLLMTFHAYYLATLAPALAVLVGIACVKGWGLIEKSPRQALILATLVLALSLAYQAYALRLYQQNFDALLAFCFLVSAFLAFLSWHHRNLRPFFALAYLFSLLAVPAFWGWATASERTNMMVPNAYEGTERMILDDVRANFAYGDLSILNDVPYTPSAHYDLAVLNQAVGADIVIASPLRVLYLGGFGGTDPIYTTEAFAGMLERGEIAYVLDVQLPSDFSAYVRATCSEVRQLIDPQTDASTGLASGGAILYDCAK